MKTDDIRGSQRLWLKVIDQTDPDRPDEGAAPSEALQRLGQQPSTVVLPLVPVKPMTQSGWDGNP